MLINYVPRECWMCRVSFTKFVRDQATRRCHCICIQLRGGALYKTMNHFSEAFSTRPQKIVSRKTERETSSPLHFPLYEFFYNWNESYVYEFILRCGNTTVALAIFISMFAARLQGGSITHWIMRAVKNNIKTTAEVYGNTMYIPFYTRTNNSRKKVVKAKRIILCLS